MLALDAAKTYSNYEKYMNRLGFATLFTLIALIDFAMFYYDLEFGTILCSIILLFILTVGILFDTENDSNTISYCCRKELLFSLANKIVKLELKTNKYDMKKWLEKKENYEAFCVFEDIFERCMNFSFDFKFDDNMETILSSVNFKGHYYPMTLLFLLLRSDSRKNKKLDRVIGEFITLIEIERKHADYVLAQTKLQELRQKHNNKKSL